MEWISRWWQSLGFGIQSKTDFAFLHDVIKEKHPYYAFQTLREHFPDATKSQMQRAELLFRVCNAIKPNRMQMAGLPSPLFAEALSMALSAKRSMTQQPDFIYGEGECVIPSFQGLKALVLTHINSSNKDLWERVLKVNSITYDMKDLGIAIFCEGRYPEHYRLQ